MSLVTFIVPSKGRPTLANTIASFYEQTDKDWGAVICYDAVEDTITSHHPHLAIINTQKKLGVGVNGAGEVRNYAINYLKGSRHWKDNHWVAMCDDDDILEKNYVQDLRNYLTIDPVPDIIVFRMLICDTGRLIPRDCSLKLKDLENDIGISFACNHKVFDKLRFEAGSGEDYQFLLKAEREGFKVFISDKVNYLVAPLSVAPDRR